MFLDDFSRYIVSWGLSTHQRSELVVEALLEGCARFGKPKEVLTDQGRQYFAWRGTSDFQKLLVREGIAHVIARAHHPETLGRCGRLWETIGREFWDRARPQELSDARQRLGHYFAHDNFFRPHQGIDGAVPADRFFAAQEALRRTIEARLSPREIEAALQEAPRQSMYVFGQIGDEQVSLVGEKGQLVVHTSSGVRREIGLDELGVPSRAARETETASTGDAKETTRTSDGNDAERDHCRIDDVPVAGAPSAHGQETPEFRIAGALPGGCLRLPCWFLRDATRRDGTRACCVRDAPRGAHGRAQRDLERAPTRRTGRTNTRRSSRSGLDRGRNFVNTTRRTQMQIKSVETLRAGIAATGILCLAGTSAGQGLVQTQGVIVATNGDPVPDHGGAPIAGFTFGPSGALGYDCVIDESGNVLFRASFVDAGGSTTAYNDTAYFYGSSRATLRMLVRAGDQAPGMGTGVLLRTSLGISSGLSSNVRLSPDGRMFWASNLFDSTGTNGITSFNNEAIFGGPFASQGLLVQQGDPAPGTVGATFVQALASTTQQFKGINSQGRLYFQAALTGGDTTTTTGMNNQVGIWSGMPGALELVVRKSGPVSGIPGVVAIDTFATIGDVTMMNDSGNLLYEVLLSTTQGTPPATTMNNRAILVHTPGSGSLPIVREGDAAPGTLGATFNAIAGSDAWIPGFGNASWTRTNETLFVTELNNGDANGTNDRAVYKGGVGTLTMVVRKGAPAPGTDAVFDSWSNSNCHLNAFGQVMLQATVAGGTSTTANDTGIWTGMPGSLTLVVREGQVMPGTGGSIAGNFSVQPTTYFNDQGRPLFRVSLSGGTITGTSLWAWDPILGLIAVALPGDQIQVSPGVFKSISGFGGVSFSNTDGAALIYGHDGRIGNRYDFSDGTNAILIVRLPSDTPSIPFCFGDGTGSPCPCGNLGAPGHGCANSSNPSGALLVGSGLASIGMDSYLLSGSGMPNSTVLYFQGNTQLTGLTFGDGLRCAAGTVIRLGTLTNVGGASHYPDASAGNLPISIRGHVTAPGIRTYQGWYRNAATFCTPLTFNLSNGVAVAWAP